MIENLLEREREREEKYKKIVKSRAEEHNYFKIIDLLNKKSAFWSLVSCRVVSLDGAIAPTVPLVCPAGEEAAGLLGKPY